MKLKGYLLMLCGLCFLLNLSCAKPKSTPPESEGSSGFSSGAAEAIIDNSGNINGPEVSCADSECSTSLEWEE